jgi:hypothetical protein
LCTRNRDYTSNENKTSKINEIRIKTIRTYNKNRVS